MKDNGTPKGKKMILRDALGNGIGHTEVIDSIPANVVESVSKMTDSAKEFIYEMWATALS